MRTWPLVFVLLLAGCTTPPTGRAPASAPPEATPSAGATPSAAEPSAPPAPLELSGPPKIAYVERSVLRYPDGRTVQLPRRWGITGIVAYAGGYLVTDDRAFEGTVGMQRLDADGRVIDAWTSTGPPLVSEDGRVAWVSMVAPESGRTGPTLLHADSLDGGAEVTQELDRSRMPFLTSWFRGRLVYETWGERDSFLTDLAHPPLAVPRAEDLGILAPGGAYAVRFRRRVLEVLHQDGQLAALVRERGLNRTINADVAWEDDSHVLTTITRGGRQAIARIGTDGGVSLATPWHAVDWAGVAFLAG